MQLFCLLWRNARTPPLAHNISQIPLINVFNWKNLDFFFFSLYTLSTVNSAYQEGVCCQIPSSSLNRWSEETGEWFLLKDTKLMARNRKKWWELDTCMAHGIFGSCWPLQNFRRGRGTRAVSSAQQNLFLRQSFPKGNTCCLSPSVSNRFFCNWSEWLLGVPLLHNFVF